MTFNGFPGIYTSLFTVSTGLSTGGASPIPCQNLSKLDSSGKIGRNLVLFPKYAPMSMQKSYSDILPRSSEGFSQDGFGGVGVQGHIRRVSGKKFIIPLGPDHCAVVPAELQGRNICLHPQLPGSGQEV